MEGFNLIADDLRILANEIDNLQISELELAKELSWISGQLLDFLADTVNHAN